MVITDDETCTCYNYFIVENYFHSFHTENGIAISKSKSCPMERSDTEAKLGEMYTH